MCSGGVRRGLCVQGVCMGDVHKTMCVRGVCAEGMYNPADHRNSQYAIYWNAFSFGLKQNFKEILKSHCCGDFIIVSLLNGCSCRFTQTAKTNF